MRKYPRKPLPPTTAYSPYYRKSANKRRPRSRFMVMLIAALLIISAVAYTTNLLSPHGPGPHSGQTAYVSPYDWEGLQKNGDRFAYYENKVLKSEVGVDVSSHQGPINWSAVASDKISFAIIRAGNRGYTEGSISADTCFIGNLEGASAAGLKTGVYFFSQAITADEAREEAQFVVTQLAGRRLDLPVAFDHEGVEDDAGRANSLAGDDLLSCEEAFCNTIEAAGYHTLIYGNKRDIMRYGRTSFGSRPVWLAEYGVNIPTAQFDFTMWQYKNDAKVAGISCPVDLNLRFILN